MGQIFLQVLLLLQGPLEANRVLQGEETVFEHLWKVLLESFESPQGLNVLEVFVAHFIDFRDSQSLGIEVQELRIHRLGPLFVLEGEKELLGIDGAIFGLNDVLAERSVVSVVVEGD